jgi:hypothetical protein
MLLIGTSCSKLSDGETKMACKEEKADDILTEFQVGEGNIKAQENQHV